MGNEKIAGISGLVLLVLGSIGIIGSFIIGSIEVYLILIIPVFVFKGIVPALSFVLILIGSVMILFARLSIKRIDDRGGQERSIEGGGVIFLGPIPIVFGSKGFKEGLPSWCKLLIVGIIVSFLFIIFSIVIYNIVYEGGGQ